MRVAVELVFPDDEARAGWQASTPPNPASFGFDPPFVPDDAPAPRAIATLFAGAKVDGSTIVLRPDGDFQMDDEPSYAPARSGWDVAAAVAHAGSFGATGRAVVREMPFAWEDPEDEWTDPRDAVVHVLLTVDGDGVDVRTLSKRQANGYLESDDLPSLAEMKARLKR